MPAPPATTQAPPPAAPAAATKPTPAGKPAGTHHNGSLYVGDLSREATEADLYSHFSRIGPLESVRICRDAVTRRSLGYGYVNYVTVADAESALEQLAYSDIKDRPCRLMWSQRDPSSRKSAEGNIFIKNLELSISAASLDDTFRPFGNILSTKIECHEDGTSKGYGYIHFEDKEAASQAIAKVNGMLLNGQMVTVTWHVPRKERLSKLAEARAQFTNLFVKNLDKAWDEAAFRDVFAPYGEISSIRLSEDPENPENKNKGFGFVDYKTHEEAEEAIKGLHEKLEVNGVKLYVQPHQRKAEREAELRRSYDAAKAEKQSKFHGVNVYVKHIEDDIDEERLKSEFAHFGTITSLKINRDADGKSKGFGYVCFSTPEEARQAISQLHNKIIGTKPLYVSLFQPKDQRRQQLENEMASRSIRNAHAAPGVPGGFMPGPMYFPQGFVPPGGRAPPGGFNGPMIPGGRGGYRGPMPGMPGMPVPMPMMPYPGMPNYPGVPGYPVPPPDMARGVPGMPPLNPPVEGDGTRDWKPGSIVDQDPSLLDRLDKAPNEDVRKNLIGEAIYPVAQRVNPEWAGKVTGMILDTGLKACDNAIKDNDLLMKTINEAVEVLVRQEYKVELPPAAAPAESG